MKKSNVFKRIFIFYYDGFRSMKVGKRLWTIIIIKLFIMFVLLKIFFFKDFLNEKFDTEKEKANYIIEQLTNLKNINND